ncbi:MAG: uroporphyrinogen-III synthase [Sphingobium sp.]|nr:MAG: uroporphyrinogen-III synthase [Sphingobium sp.]
MSRPVLFLRPEPDSENSVAAARAAGFDADAYPLFLIAPVPWTGPEPELVDAVMFTSANAARHGGAQLGRYRHLPAFAVGEATAAAVRAAGFASVHAGTSGVQALVDYVLVQGHRAVLHISGHDIRTFDPHGLRVSSACVYAAVESGSAAGLIEHLQSGTAILVHSPRAGARLAALLPLAQRADFDLVAISPAARDAAGTGWRHSFAADEPREKAMLALAAALCD